MNDLHVEIAKILIEAGADVKAEAAMDQTLSGYTPLHLCRSPAIAELLIANGADVMAV